MTERNQVFTPEHLTSGVSPRKVVHETGTLLPIYFGDLFDGEDTRYAINYFRGPTLDFLSDARRGFLLHRDVIRAQANERELRRLQSQEELTTEDEKMPFPYTKSFESYGLTLVILSQMPHWEEQPRYFRGLSRLPLAVPTDNMGMLDRLDELREFVEATAKQKLTPRNLNRVNDATQRSLAFFQLGKKLVTKIKEPSSLDEEIARILRDAPLN